MNTFIRNEEIISGQIDEDLVMVDIEQGSYFSLNPVATFIWGLLESSLTIQELCCELTSAYEVSLEQCQLELEEHLSKMEDVGLIKRLR